MALNINDKQTAIHSMEYLNEILAANANSTRATKAVNKKLKLKNLKRLWISYVGRQYAFGEVESGVLMSLYTAEF